MFVFLLGDYRLPLAMIELDSFTRTHTHRTAWGDHWKEDMHLKACIPGMMPTSLHIANDNRRAADHG